LPAGSPLYLYVYMCVPC